MSLPDQNVVVWGKVADQSGNHQLVLKYASVGAVPTVSNGTGYDFYSLSWEVKDGTWKDKVVITKADFQRGYKRQRFVTSIHSFYPDTGVAILKIGELWPNKVPGMAVAVYSWREWDLANNREVHIARVCKSPFEAFEEIIP